MKGEKVHICLPAGHQYLEVLGTAVTTLVSRAPQLANEAYNLQLAIHEAGSNIIDHAYQGKGGHYFEARLEVDCENGRFLATLQDQGQAYLPTCAPSETAPFWQGKTQDNSTLFTLVSVPEPTFEQIRGRGLFLMHNLVDEIMYDRIAKVNYWHLCRNFM